MSVGGRWDTDGRWEAFLPKAANILRCHHKAKKQTEGSPATINEQIAVQRIIMSWHVHCRQWEETHGR